MTRQVGRLSARWPLSCRSRRPPASGRARRRRPAPATGLRDRSERRADAEAGGAARRGRRGRRRRRDDVEGHGHHRAVPGARPGVVSRRSCRARGWAFSSALWTQVGAQAVIKMKASGGQLEGKVFVVARGDQADAVQELPQRRHPRRRPRVRQRHRAVVHRQARRVRLAHRVRDDRPRRARDRLRRHGRRADGGADEDGLRQPAAGVFARRRRDRVHVVRAQQPGPLDRLGGRRTRAARVEAAGPEHGRGVVARRARPSR